MLIPSLDVVNVSSQEDAPGMDAVSRSIAHLKNKFSNVLDKTPHGKRTAVFRLQNDSLDDDDFVVRETRSGKSYSPVPARKRKDPAVNSNAITTTRRPTRKPAKWCNHVDVLKPGQFVHLKNAKLLKDFMLSKYAVDKYGR